MPDREKVIQGLKRCGSNFWEGHLCEGCPYFPEMKGCMGVLHHDALALLKEQEPRVMTREEVIRSQDWIWYQWKNTHCGWTLAVDCDEEWIEWEDLTTDQLCKYGKQWRCWTSRPTPEQMRDTKWEGDSDASR